MSLNKVEDGQDTTTYTYDALDRRSTKTSAGNIETAHYGDLSDIPIFDTDGTGQLTTSYVAALPDVSSHTNAINSVLSNQVNMSKQASIGQVLGPVAPINPLEGLSGTKDPAGMVEERDNSQTSYPLADAHGDITSMTDSAGSVSSRYSYDPWGVQSPGTQREMGYLGAYLRRSDPDTGLTQMGARQYEPSLGRFMSEDRVLGRSSLGQSWNRHSYVYDRPLVLYDLDGEMPWPKVPSLPTHNEIVKGIGKGGKWIGKGGKFLYEDYRKKSECYVTGEAEACEELSEARRSIIGKDLETALQCVTGGGGAYKYRTPIIAGAIRYLKFIPGTTLIVVGGCVLGTKGISVK